MVAPRGLGLVSSCLLGVLAVACLDPDARKHDSAEGDTDADADADTDTDADSDTDVDTGPTDADGDGWTIAGGDCDDSDAAVHPGAEEVCNGLDDDCVDGVDEGATDAATWCRDADGDGYGSADQTEAACSQPAGFAFDCSDCDDDAPASFPGAAEYIRDGLDSNCNGWVDERIVPDDYATVQAGVDATIDGDVVLVRAGTYREAVGLPNRAVHLLGEAGASSTIIDSSGLGGGALYAYGISADVEVEGFWFKGEDSSSGGIVYIGGTTGDFYLHDAIIAGNLSARIGLMVHYGNATIERVTVAENGSTTNHIAVYLVGYERTEARNLLVVNNAGYGVVVGANHVAVDLDHMTIVGNGAMGVLTQTLATGTISVGNSIIADNGQCGIGRAAGTSASYTDAWGNVDGSGTSCDAPGWTSFAGTDGNISADPQFVGWSPSATWGSLDMHLGSGSPCADAGDPSQMDLDGSRADMGFYGGYYAAP